MSEFPSGRQQQNASAHQKSAGTFLASPGGGGRKAAVISLIGRPNVGKSTLFNILLHEAHKAITLDLPGVTRDRHYGILSLDEWPQAAQMEAIVIDTGGFYPKEEMLATDPRRGQESKKMREEQKRKTFFNLMRQHAQMAITESDLVIMVVDAREGILPFDELIAERIRSQHRPFWVVVNKMDSPKQLGEEAQFYALGVGASQLFSISAAHNIGILDLRQELHRFVSEWREKVLPAEKAAQQLAATSATAAHFIPSTHVAGSLAIVGAPNAGKSTLLNRLLGEERSLVSDIAGTTLDPVEAYLHLDFGPQLELILQEQERQQRKREAYARMDELYQRSGQQQMDDVGEEAFEIEDEIENEIDGEGEVEGEDQWEDDLQELQEDLQEELQEESQNNLQKDPSSQQVHPLRETSGVAPVKIVDTAGIRKKSAIHEELEALSVYRALQSITQADVVLYIVDAQMGIGHQDRRLCDIALEKGKSVIICLNKFDLMKEVQRKQGRTQKDWMEDLKDTVPWLNFCQMIPISAKTGFAMGPLKEAIKKTLLVRSQRVATRQLNHALTLLVQKNPIVLKKSGGVPFKIKYASMIRPNPPTLLLFCNRVLNLPPHYRRYLINGLRQHFPFGNTPLRLVFRKVMSTGGASNGMDDGEEELGKGTSKRSGSPTH